MVVLSVPLSEPSSAILDAAEDDGRRVPLSRSDECLAAAG